MQNKLECRIVESDHSMAISAHNEKMKRFVYLSADLEEYVSDEGSQGPAIVYLFSDRSDDGGSRCRSGLIRSPQDLFDFLKKAAEFLEGK